VRGNPVAATAGDERGETAEELLARVSGMVPAAVARGVRGCGDPGTVEGDRREAGHAPGAPVRPVQRHPPCFAWNALCGELLQSVAATLADAAKLAARPPGPERAGGKA
jgi:hypothetical protein